MSRGTAPCRDVAVLRLTARGTQLAALSPKGRQATAAAGTRRMRVQIKLRGVLSRAAGPGPADTFDLLVPEKTTAGDLLATLAERWGGPFGQALASSDRRLPRHIRMFADGEMLTHREQALTRPGAPVRGVTVVLLTPMMGG